MFAVSFICALAHRQRRLSDLERARGRAAVNAIVSAPYFSPQVAAITRIAVILVIPVIANDVSENR